MRPDSDEIAFPDLTEVLLRRRWWLLGVLLLCLAVGFWLALAPRKYTADSMLRVQVGAESQYHASPSAPAPTDVADQFSPYVDILESRTLFLRVAKDLNLANDPAFIGAPIVGSKSLDDPAVRNATLRAMRERIAVIHRPKDEIIRVTCATNSPTLSARVVNTLINDFVEDLVEARYGASKRASGWLVGQLGDLKRQVESDQQSLTALQAKLGIVGLNDKDSDYLFTQSLNSLTKASSDSTVERIVAEAKYRFLQDSDPGLIEGEVSLLGGPSAGASQPTSLLQNLRNAQAVQSSEFARLRAQFGPNYPDLLQKKSQLDETTRQVDAEQKRILNQAKLSFSAAAANEQMTEKALQEKQGQAFGLRNDMVRYVILQHDYETHRTLYENLISRLQEAGITAGLEGGAVDIVDLADVPTLPSPPGRTTFLGGALLAGLVLGSILVFFLEALNTHILTPDQARRASALPLLAVLPRSSSNFLELGTHEDSPYTEAIESLRSALLTGRSTPPQVILLTSPVSGEGKTRTATHLAATLAQHRERVLLIDCDLRNNTVASRLDLSSAIGLSSILTGEATLASAVQPLPAVPSLSVLVSGRQSGQRAALLLGSPEFAGLIRSAREHFRFVILNCAPVLGLSDVLNAGAVADAIVLVARSKVTQRKSLHRTEQVLLGAKLPVLGFVLNGAESEAEIYNPGRSSTQTQSDGVAA